MPGKVNGEFRSTRWRIFWGLGLFVAVTALTVFYNRSFEFSWISGFFIGFSILAFFGFLEASTDYLFFDKNEFTFRKAFRKTTVKRGEIEKAVWEKGSGVSVRLLNGEWVKIPGFGHNPQVISNSVNSWINDRER